MHFVFFLAISGVLSAFAAFDELGTKVYIFEK